MEGGRAEYNSSFGLISVNVFGLRSVLRSAQEAQWVCEDAAVGPAESPPRMMGSALA